MPRHPFTEEHAAQAGGGLFWRLDKNEKARLVICDPELTYMVVHWVAAPEGSHKYFCCSPFSEHPDPDTCPGCAMGETKEPFGKDPVLCRERENVYICNIALYQNANSQLTHKVWQPSAADQRQLCVCGEELEGDLQGQEFAIESDSRNVKELRISMRRLYSTKTNCITS